MGIAFPSNIRSGITHVAARYRFWPMARVPRIYIRHDDYHYKFLSETFHHHKYPACFPREYSHREYPARYYKAAILCAIRNTKVQRLKMSTMCRIYWLIAALTIILFPLILPWITIWIIEYVSLNMHLSTRPRIGISLCKPQGIVVIAILNARIVPRLR